ncbi:hypothetical protein HYE54_12205 [Aggregatibacter actinomycetemcomitans]|uniref:hypothetical protein n=1 Tax=Aggregatibacter actinomycetemcomitans TaxID=714 RepID=UPI00197C1158|nr:hypothetical protein [Aggregatibacter actinomycetemcomitans]MBN6069458.1 hypothetical protein [Aggregatibacter actinomycetemcomitans]MBN6085341.1 hypothetical protein [Aggregatibacter actinomycetemcomitans]
MSLPPELDYLMQSLSCVTYNGNQHSDIQVNESDPSAKLNSINIKMGNGDWFCFSPDEGRKCKRIHNQAKNVIVMSPLLTVDKSFSHHCACDAVVFLKKDDGLLVLYMDLKSDNPTGYSSQFKSTRQFVKYLIGLYEEFTGSKLSISDERYIIFHNNKKLLSKTTTVPKSKIGQTAPDRAYKRPISNGDSVYLKELLA